MWKAEWDFSHYSSLIHSYSRRKLSYASDALNGIKGILSRITKQTGVEFVHGLPQSDLINGLLWYPDPNRPALYNTFQQHRTTVDSSRRNTFPSWSWLSCIPRGVDFAHLQYTPAQTTYPARAIWKSNFGKDDTVWVIDTAQVHASNSSTLLTIMTESITVTMVPDPMSPDWFLHTGPPRWAVEQLEGEITTIVTQDPSYGGWGSPTKLRELAFIECWVMPYKTSPGLYADLGRCAVRLLKLVRMTREAEDIVLSMVVYETKDGMLERLGLLAIPYEYWAGRDPKQCTEFIQ